MRRGGRGVFGDTVRNHSVDLDAVCLKALALPLTDSNAAYEARPECSSSFVGMKEKGARSEAEAALGIAGRAGALVAGGAIGEELRADWADGFVGLDVSDGGVIEKHWQDGRRKTVAEHHKMNQIWFEGGEQLTQRRNREGVVSHGKSGEAASGGKASMVGNNRK